MILSCLTALSRSAVKVCGLALVLAAVATPALAWGNPPPCPTPEIDAGSIGSALTVLSGGAILLMHRLRRR
ncbi:MAG TPA: hypothetical protein VKA46_41200 [Gemmataceae bacterium]|nr:hypothetical protein [Gemmataceae bacterium]